MKSIIKIIPGIVIAVGIVYFFSLNTQKSVGADINYFYDGTNSAVTVSTSNTTVLARNTGRQYAVIVNDGANPVYLSLGGTAVANSGIRLNAQGGSFEITNENLFGGVINGIATGGSSVVTVFEK
jgi:hypothetical protein